MSRLSGTFSDMIICGYLRKRFTNNGMSIYVDIIKSFYNTNNVVPVKIISYDTSKGKFIIDSPNHGNIVDVCGDNNAFFLISSDNRVYVYGTGINELGIGVNNCKTIQKHAFFKDKLVNFISKSVQCYHLFAYTQNNELYTWGKNVYKITDKSGDVPDNIHKPVLFPFKFDSKLKDIAVGQTHAIFLSSNGQIYGCGSNLFGQLSFKDSQKCKEIMLLPNFKHIIQIKCCNFTSYALNESGILTAFGDNDFNELGIPKTVKNKERSNIINKSEYKIIYHVQTGEVYCGFITNKHELYMFGDNDHGQCGSEPNTETKKRVTHPTKVSINNDKIMDVKCGGIHTIIKTFSNKYYYCGSNNTRLINHDNAFKHDIYPPKQILLQYIYDQIGCNSPIIDIIPSRYKTIFLQKV